MADIVTLPKTLFIDLDGCIFKHHGEGQSGQVMNLSVLLDGVQQKLDAWEAAGHMIVITTGRREGLRRETIEQLRVESIPYDLLIMGCRRGERVVINDLKPGNNVSVANYFEVERNVGLREVQLSAPVASMCQPIHSGSSCEAV